ncbi:MAG: GPP34 family phosphoprotein [Myxococcales bacterium]|nr:GPP34 family phosphoprotein [Myxococcales bacterium]
MSLPLPDALFLLALHPTRGTVHAAAYRAIEHGMRAAVLLELKLRGYIQVKRDGQGRVHPDAPEPPGHVLLRDTLDAMRRDAERCTVEAWLDLVQREVPDLRGPVVRRLQQAGILRAVERERIMLPDQITLPTADPAPREDLLAVARAALDAGDALKPRHGALVGLVVACHLERPVFEVRARAASLCADWVAERDAIVRTLRRVVAETEAGV